MTPKVIWNGLPIDTETLVSKHKSCVNSLGKLCEENAQLTADNARLQARVAELEQSRSIVKTQLSNIEWNLQRQDNPSKDDWLRMIRNMLESLK